MQPSRFRIGDAGSRFRLSKKLIRTPPTGASKGLARDSRRVQLGFTRGEGVAVQNSQVSIVVFVNESMNASRQRVANQSKGVEVYGRWKQVERVLSARKPRRRSQQIVKNTSWTCSPHVAPVRRRADSPPLVVHCRLLIVGHRFTPRVLSFFSKYVGLSPLPPSPSPRTHPRWCEVMAKVGGDVGCLTPSVEPELSQPGKTVEAIEYVLIVFN